MRFLIFILLSMATLIIFHMLHQPFDYVPQTGYGYAFGVAGTLCLLEASRYHFRRKVYNIHRPTRRYFYELHLYMGWWGLFFGLLHANFKYRGTIPKLLVYSILGCIGVGILLSWFWKLYFIQGYRIPPQGVLKIHDKIRWAHGLLTLLTLLILFIHIIRSIR